MLTFDQVIKLRNDEGIKFRIIFKKPVSDFSGEFFDEEDLIKMYLKNSVDRKSFEVTLIHELIHARNERFKIGIDEEDYVESEATITWYHCHEIVEKIIDLFKIKIPKKLEDKNIRYQKT